MPWAPPHPGGSGKRIHGKGLRRAADAGEPVVAQAIEVVDPGDGKGNDYSTGIGGQADASVEEREFYDLSVIRTDPTGFGVQIGSYQELANLIRLADNLKASYKKKVTVQVSIINNMKVYKIIIGQEKNRGKAEKLREKLRKRYPDSFIVNFNPN